ncbi:unnamed protein product [Closterium sp. NIES-53]
MVTILHEIGMLFRPDPISRRGIASSGSTSYTSPGPRACDPISSASNGALSHAVRYPDSMATPPVGAPTTTMATATTTMATATTTMAMATTAIATTRNRSAL